MKKEMLVGALFLLAVCLATFAAIVLSGADFFRPKTTWTVELDNLGGLEEENDVRVLGHRMGTVESIQFDRQKYKFKVFLKMFIGSACGKPLRSARNTSPLIPARQANRGRMSRG